MSQNLDAARRMVHEVPGAGSGLVTAHALIAIAEELQKLNDTLEYINGKLTVPPKELK